MDKQQVPPSYGLFLLGKKQRKQSQSNGDELSQSNASQGELESLGNVYRDKSQTSGSDVPSRGYHATEHNNLLNEVRSQLSDLRDLLSASKSSDPHEPSIEPSDLRITDEQLAQMPSEERSLFLRRIQDLQNELLSEDVSSSISTGDALSRGVRDNRMQAQYQITTVNQPVLTPKKVAPAKSVPAADFSGVQGAKVVPPRMGKQQLSTPHQTPNSNKLAPSSRTPGNSSYAFADDSRRSVIEQPRIVSIQRANLEVDNMTTMSHTLEESGESDFSTSDITDVIEANVVLPPKLPLPPPAINQRSTSSRRTKTPVEPRTVIQRVKPEIDDIVLPPVESMVPYDSDPEPDEYNAKLTVRRRPQSAGYGDPGLQRGDAYSSERTKHASRPDQYHGDSNIQHSFNDQTFSDPAILSASALPTRTRAPNFKQSGGSDNIDAGSDLFTANDKGSCTQFQQNNMDIISSNNAISLRARRSISQSETGRRLPNQVNTDAQAIGSYGAYSKSGPTNNSYNQLDDDDGIGNICTTTSNFVKLPKHSKPSTHELLEDSVVPADVMTIPENTVLYKPKAHEHITPSFSGGRLSSGSKMQKNKSHQNTLEGEAQQDFQDDISEPTNILFMRKEPAVRPKPTKDSMKDNLYTNTYGASMQGTYSEDISVEDDVQETKLLISMADAGRSRLVVDKSSGEKRQKRQRSGPNHMVITQLAQYETKPSENPTYNESDYEEDSSDPEITISKLVYPKLTAAEQEKLRRLAELRPKRPKAVIPDVRVYGRPTEGEVGAVARLSPSTVEQPSRMAIADVSVASVDNPYLYSNVTPYFEYKRKMTKGTAQISYKGKSLNESISEETPAQEVTQFVNDKYVAMARENGIKDPSLLYGDSRISIKSSSFSNTALHIRSDMTLGDIARSGRKFVVARKEDTIITDASRLTAPGRDGQANDSSDSEPQYEDMTILPAAEPYYGLPQPDFESFNQSIQSMRQSLLLKSSNTQSTSLTENPLDERILRTKEAIKAAERQNGLSPSMLATGSMSINWNPATSSPSAYMPQIVSPAAHPRIRPTSRSHPPVPEPPLPDFMAAHVDGTQISNATVARMNAMSDMVMPDRTASNSSASSGVSSGLMQQLQKYGTIDPKIGLQNSSGIPRSSKIQTTTRSSGASSSQGTRSSRPGQSQPSGHLGSMSGPRPSKRRYLQASTTDLDSVTEAVALAEFILTQNRSLAPDIGEYSNLLAVLSDLQVPLKNKLPTSSSPEASVAESTVFRDYIISGLNATSESMHIHKYISSINRLIKRSQSDRHAQNMPSYYIANTIISQRTPHLTTIPDYALIKYPEEGSSIFANHSLDNSFLRIERAIAEENSIAQIDISLPTALIQSTEPAPHLSDTFISESSDSSDIALAIPEYTLKASAQQGFKFTTATIEQLDEDLDSLSYALQRYEAPAKPILLEHEVECIQNFSNDHSIVSSLNVSEIVFESTAMSNMIYHGDNVQYLQTPSYGELTQRHKSLIDLKRNRRSSLQYYKTAQLVLCGFIPSTSSEPNITQCHNPSYLPKTISQSSQLGSAIEDYNQATSMEVESGNHFQADANTLQYNDVHNPMPSDNITKEIILCPKTDRYSCTFLDNSFAAVKSPSVAKLFVSSVENTAVKSTHFAPLIESEELDISLTETLVASTELQPKANHLPYVTEHITSHLIDSLSQVVQLKDYVKDTPPITECHTNVELIIRQQNVESPHAPVQVSYTIPIYTLDPSALETTRCLYVEPIWHSVSEQILLDAMTTFEIHNPISPHFYTAISCIEESKDVENLFLKYEKRTINFVRSDVVPCSTTIPIYLEQPQIKMHSAIKEYMIQPIIKSSTDIITTAMPDYTINLLRCHNSVISTPQLHKENLSIAELTAKTTLISRDPDAFELNIPSIRREYDKELLVQHYTDTHLDVVAMHSVIVNENSVKTKANILTTVKDAMYNYTASKELNLSPNNIHISDLGHQKSQSLFANVGEPLYKIHALNQPTYYLSNTQHPKPRSHSVQREYLYNSNSHEITVTRLGNRDFISLAKQTVASSNLKAQRTYTLKMDQSTYEPLIELTIPRYLVQKQPVLNKDSQRLHTISTPFATSNFNAQNCGLSVETENPVITIQSTVARHNLHGRQISQSDKALKPQITLDVAPQQANNMHTVPEYHNRNLTTDDALDYIPDVRLEINMPVQKRQQPNTSNISSQPSSILQRLGTIRSYSIPLSKPSTQHENETLEQQIPKLSTQQHLSAPIDIITTAIHSELESYTTFPTLEGPSLPLNLEFSKPEHILSSATLDGTLESTLLHEPPKYTNFDTPSAIPSTQITTETTFQTPEAMTGGVSTNLLLYPQTELCLRASASNPGCINVPSPNPQNVGLVETKIQQLYTQCSFYAKALTEPLDTSVFVQEYRKTDLIRSLVRLHPDKTKEQSEDYVVPLSFVTRYQEQIDHTRCSNVKLNQLEELEKPINPPVNVPPTSTSVSQLLGQINVAIGHTEKTHCKPLHINNQLKQDTDYLPCLASSSTDMIMETSALTEYQTQAKPATSKKTKILPCSTTYEPANNSESFLLTIPNSSKQDSFASPHNTNMNRKMDFDHSVVNVSIEAIPALVNSAQQTQLQKRGYKPALTDRCMETLGPYTLRKETANKGVLAKDVTYTIERRSTKELCARERIDRSIDGEIGEHLMEYHISDKPTENRATHYPLLEELAITQMESSIKQRSLDGNKADHPSDCHKGINSQPSTIEDASKMSEILLILRSLTDIAANTVKYVQDHANSLQSEQYMKYYQEFSQTLDRLSASVNLSMNTIQALHTAYLSLNDTLVDKIVLQIRNMIPSNLMVQNPMIAVITNMQQNRIQSNSTQTKADQITISHSPMPSPTEPASHSKSRLEELLFFEKELTKGKATMEKYAHLLQSPATSTSSVRPDTSASLYNPIEPSGVFVPLEPVHTTNTITTPDTNSEERPLNGLQPRLKLDIDPQTNLRSSGPIVDYTYPPNHDASIFNLQTPRVRPLKPKKEVYLPVISNGFIARISAEAKRRASFSERALTDSKTLGPYLRKVSYTENSIVGHTTFYIFDEIMNTVTVECVESIKSLMGL